MLEPKQIISDDLSLFLKTYLTSQDYKDSIKKCSNPPSEELIRAVVRQERRMSTKSIPCIEKMIVIAAKKRTETNPVFTKVLREHSDIIKRYKTK